MYARSIGGAAAAAAIVAVSFTTVTAQRGQGAAPADNVPTPRMADGHPDLNGWWGGGGGGFGGGRTLADLTDEKGNVYLQRPWVWNPRMVRLNTDPKAAFWDDPPCNDEDLEHIVTKERG